MTKPLCCCTVPKFLTKACIQLERITAEEWCHRVEKKKKNLPAKGALPLGTGTGGPKGVSAGYPISKPSLFTPISKLSLFTQACTTNTCKRSHR